MSDLLIVQGSSNSVDVIAFWCSFLVAQDARFHPEVFDAEGRHYLYIHKIHFCAVRISSTANSKIILSDVST